MRYVSDEFLTEVAGSHRMVTRVTLLAYDDTHLEPTAYDMTAMVDGSVTLDQTAATRGRLDLTLTDDGTSPPEVPTTADSLLVPYGNEIQVYRGVQYADASTELVSIGVFRIDDVTVEDTPTGLSIKITGLDRSARIIDARFEDAFQIDAATNYIDALVFTLQQAWPAVPYDFPDTDAETPAVLIAAEGDDRWAFCQDIATSLGMRLYFDGDGVCTMKPVSPGTDPVLTLGEGDGGVLVAATSGWTRQGSYNRVIATGENTGATTPARGVATDSDPSSPTYYYGPYGKVPMFYSSQFITTDAQAQDAAAGLLVKQLGTTQNVSFSIVTNPSLEPDDVVTITRARAGIDQVHTIDALTIGLRADAVMTGQTRSYTLPSLVE